ncbi:MAG TPA: sulfur oxidation c-type cytochrome SoxA [Paracoccaceae bacterium]|nr:sulfur oxidation c-type cytochrome SoxA [Paracoccaceae bacterium]
MRALALWLLLALPVAAQDPAPVSGYDFLDAGTRALQDDDFLNPGFFAVERGAALWRQADGATGQSCADCHGDGPEAMRGVAARYPLVDAQTGALMNLELRINDERVRRLQAEPLALDSDEMIALTAWLSFQSRGMPMQVTIDAAARPFFDRGRDYYFQRRGQLDLACTHCHDGLVGQKLRGDTISEGQINGFPIYRILWREMGSRHRMFEWCNTSLRAEPHAPGSPEYLELELYLAWRGRGLPIEAPAVRR